MSGQVCCAIVAKFFTSSFSSDSGKQFGPDGRFLLRLDMQPRLCEERSQLRGAMKALHTKNSHQPVWEAGVHEDKASLRTKHTRYLPYACCLILPVVEREGAQYQVNRGILEWQ